MSHQQATKQMEGKRRKITKISIRSK